MTWKVSVILPELAIDIWPKVLPYIERVVEQADGRASAADALNRILTGSAQLWAIYDPDTLDVTGAMVTRVTEYPAAKFLTVEMLGGDNFDEWMRDADTALTVLGEHLGLDGVEEYGRRGWIRKLDKLGWREQFCITQRRFKKKE